MDRTLSLVARSMDTPPSTALRGSEGHPGEQTGYTWPSKDDHRGPTPGALQGDDVTLDYYEDGYPKLPACLDRRPIPVAEAA